MTTLRLRQRLRSKVVRGCRKETGNWRLCLVRVAKRQASRSFKDGKFNCRLSFDATTVTGLDWALFWAAHICAMLRHSPDEFIAMCASSSSNDGSSNRDTSFARESAIAVWQSDWHLPIVLLLSLSAKLVFFLSIGDFDCSKRPGQARPR